jgi:Kef-type K+ transport system membrane component KefB
MSALLPLTAYYALLEIFVLLAFAEVLHSLGRRVGVPEIVADLLAGMVLSGFAVGGIINQFLGFQLFVVNSYVALFATFSVVLLLFAAGLEAGFSSLRTAGFYAVIAAIVGDLVAFFATFAVFTQLIPVSAALLVAVASAATSSAVVASLIRVEGVGETVGGKFLINVAALDDVVALILLSIILTLIGGQFNVVAVTGGAAYAIAAWIVLLLASVLVIPRVLRLKGLERSQDLPFVILFAMVAIVVALGFSAVIGAYIAGLAVAESLVAPRTRQMTAVLMAIFGALFFVVIGAQFKVALLLDPWVVGAGLLLATLAAFGKFAGVFPFARLRLGNNRDARTVSVAMVPRGEIGLLVGAIGVTSGILDNRLLGVIVLMAIITTLVGAILFRQTFPGTPAAKSVRLPSDAETRSERVAP